MSNAVQQNCRVCGSEGNLRRCSKCKIAYYCSQVHQESDWRVHKIECKKFSNTSSMQTNNNSSTGNLFDSLDSYRENEHISLWPNLTPTSSHSPSSLLSDSGHGYLSENSDVSHYLPETNSYFAKDEQSEKSQRHFNTLSDNTMQICDDSLMSSHLLTSESRNEDLCKQIINDMNVYGLSVIDDFLGMQKGLEILNEVHCMYSAGVFQNGQIVSSALAERDLQTIRSDKITWVKGTESGCINIGFLINQIDSVVISANKMHDNGILGNYKIRERTKAMVACYPGSGAHYLMHVDNPNKDGRVITAIYYLNLNWETKRSGGILRIFPEQGGTVADIEPKFDRIIFFWSDRRNPHEVQPAHRTRYAITVWYFDAEERESARNRYRQYPQKVT
ncbi:Egl nine like 1 [Pseudolycoriella hygida]|uniref:hypoxia-inducible factor-proline dioxygenase n=1 Tax=Pseudolycoriella hygida TaxID=35572 RepID=A0A9Q0MY82_9DIPT|nr:Egl nine like 1 [Pseudolycoriella hygida]